MNARCHGMLFAAFQPWRNRQAGKKVSQFFPRLEEDRKSAVVWRLFDFDMAA